jgi:hypothetical protein
VFCGEELVYDRELFIMTQRIDGQSGASSHDPGRHLQQSQVRQAIAKLSESPCPENRKALYAVIMQGHLLLVVRQPIQGVGSTPVRIKNDTPADFLATSSPDGGKALVAFTDLESVSGRPSATGCAVVVMEARAVLEMAVRDNYDGLIVNPNGPWAGIPREDIVKITATDPRGQ